MASFSIWHLLVLTVMLGLVTVFVAVVWAIVRALRKPRAPRP
jgi:hypothetical protein